MKTQAWPFVDVKSVKKEMRKTLFSGPYFPVFGLNTEIYSEK